MNVYHSLNKSLFFNVVIGLTLSDFIRFCSFLAET